MQNSQYILLKYKNKFYCCAFVKHMVAILTNWICLSLIILQARAGRTTLVIAHRLSTIKTADIICGFDKGKVVEKGTHNDLMERKGIYHTLVTNQVCVCVCVRVGVMLVYVSVLILVCVCVYVCVCVSVWYVWLSILVCIF